MREICVTQVQQQYVCAEITVYSRCRKARQLTVGAAGISIWVSAPERVIVYHPDARQDVNQSIVQVPKLSLSPTLLSEVPNAMGSSWCS